MKCNYLIAVLAASISFVACSSSDDVSNVDTTTVPAASEDAIQLAVVSVSPTASATPKSVGSVGIDGDVASSDVEKTSGNSKWHGEAIYVYQLNKGTMTPTTLSYDGAVNQVINYENAKMYAPGSEKYPEQQSANEGLSVREDGQLRYYPISGVSDFWGYYLDDAYATAAEKTAGTPKPTLTTTQASVNFQINGGQDIMTAKTKEKTTDYVDEMKDLYAKMGFTDGKFEYLYSSRTARKDIQPTLIFEHQLRRLTFTGATNKREYSKDADYITADSMLVKSEAKDSDLVDLNQYWADRLKATQGLCRGVYLDSICVKSRSKGTLVFASTSGVQSCTFSSADKGTYMTLRERVKRGGTTQAERTLQRMYPKLMPLASEGNTLDIGEALLLEPQEKYDMVFLFHQYVKVYEESYIQEMNRRIKAGETELINDPTTQSFVQKYRRVEYSYPKDPTTPYTVSLPGNHGTAGGYSYSISMNITGLEQIDIDAKLQDWIFGGDTTVDFQ